MRGAAHCIQTIDPPTIGLPNTKWRPPPDLLDSSASEYESSGDESIDEAHARPPRVPRLELSEEEVEARYRRRRRRHV